MRKKAVVMVESAQNEKLLIQLLSFIKHKLPDWQITVITILNKTRNSIQSASNYSKNPIVKEITTIDDVIPILKSSSLVIARSNPIIDEILPYLAGKTGSMILNRCANISFDTSFNLFKISKDIYGSRVKASFDIKAFNHNIFISLTSLDHEFINTFIEEDFQHYSLYIETVFGNQYKTITEKITSNTKIDLMDASIVVSGGRGIRDKDDFELLRLLADRLNGALGASRAAVDEGFAEEESQVGQTGKTIRADFYIAFGISGSTQHIAGMRNSKTIIAVNKDPEAPIFKFADYGIVHDYKEIVLNLMDKLASK